MEVSDPHLGPEPRSLSTPEKTETTSTNKANAIDDRR